MKAVCLLLFLIPILLNAQNLEDYRWHNRVVVLVHIDHKSGAFRQQQQALDAHKNDLEERDMIVLAPKPGDKRKLLTQLGVPSAFEGVLLIGKDGGIKLQESFPVHLETLFTVVDAMPMRRAEIKRKKGAN